MKRFDTGLLFVTFVGAVVISGCNSNESNTPTTVQDNTAPQANYTWIQTNILNVQCTGCHSGANPPAGVNLSSYQAIMNSNSAALEVLDPGDPSSSLLYTETLSGAMPKGGTPLSSADLQAIYDWIQSGASETAE